MNRKIVILAFFAAILGAHPSKAEIESSFMGVKYKPKLCMRPMINYPYISGSESMDLAISEISYYRQQINKYHECMINEAEKDLKEIANDVGNDIFNERQELDAELRRYISHLEAMIKK